MAAKRVMNGVYAIAMGQVNAFLIDAHDSLTLIDAGFPNREHKVLAAIRELDRAPSDLKHLILTHSHPDHIGSAAAIVRATGARTYMHSADSTIAQSGGPFRMMSPAPGLLSTILCRLFFNPGERVAPVTIDHALRNGDTLPIGGGIDVVHAPGHCAGQVVLLWRPGSVLFAADLFTNNLGVGDPIGFEEIAVGRESQKRAGELAFDHAVFSHGKPIIGNAAAAIRKWNGSAR